ncbi:carboxylesterase family protein [Cuneatibacter sp. NSJ-177]|uniref:carboxylesterase/lipase family protein n=1 Tax=Cuneatibacter sp. NSJ-177 TaxID=2931401 RepID=UPI001FD3ECA8|nr:carboxylesterase family protein [Cuneatibacter sp. NSJ-177]MCJ7835092.1 carboxylesterase family protein [Cuneatibacter sp. NSJ-177]
MALLIAKVESGVLRGTYSGNDKVSVFKGVPYAAPPVGELRWREPQPPEPWEGVRDAYTFSDICLQEQAEKGSFYQKEFYEVRFPMSEDCLYLNIWTPAESDQDRLPVAFFIHGGGFSAGMGINKSYDGEAFGKRGVVTVTINYRVGVYGFLAHPELTAENEHASSGNYGLLDQIAALKWVRKNIAAFGGDPEQITIFGQSAGGGSVQLLCGSPLTRGDIRRAIIQSSIVLAPLREPINKPLAAAEQFGADFVHKIGVSSIKEARGLSGEELLSRYIKFKGGRFGLYFKPVVDGYAVEDDMLNQVLKNKHHRISYLMGGTLDEMANGPMEAPKEAPKDRSSYEIIRDEMGPASEYYFEIPKEEREDISEMPARHICGCCAWSELQVEQGRTPVYQYLFSHTPPGDDHPGAFHSAEHPYVFQTLFRIWRPYRGEDMELSNLACGYWTNFIKFGNPNGEGLPEWTPYTKECPEVMELKPNAGMKRLFGQPFVRLKNKEGE